MDLTATGVTELAAFRGRMRPRAARVGRSCQEHSPLNQPGADREKAPCPSFHPPGLLICGMTLVPLMALASADSNRSFAPRALAASGPRLELRQQRAGSPGQPSRGRVVNGSAMEVSRCCRVLAREAAACRAAPEQWPQ